LASVDDVVGAVDVAGCAGGEEAPQHSHSRRSACHPIRVQVSMMSSRSSSRLKSHIVRLISYAHCGKPRRTQFWVDTTIEFAAIRIKKASTAIGAPDSPVGGTRSGMRSSLAPEVPPTSDANQPEWYFQGLKRAFAGHQLRQAWRSLARPTVSTDVTLSPVCRSTPTGRPMPTEK
jgi:hypothetical protein